MKASTYVAAAILFLLSLPCFADPVNLGTQKSLSPQQAASLHQEVVFLDVRSTLEWLMGHVKGAVHIPYDEVPGKVASAIPDRSVPIVTYCASGARASYVVDAMRKLGYTVVPVVDGGYRELIANGMEKD